MPESSAKKSQPTNKSLYSDIGPSLIVGLIISISTGLLTSYLTTPSFAIPPLFLNLLLITIVLIMVLGLGLVLYYMKQEINKKIIHQLRNIESDIFLQTELDLPELLGKEE